MPEREPQSNNAEWEKLASLLGSLPLETCTRECNPITKEWGWKASQGKIFRISGQFVVSYDADPSDMSTCRPLASADLLKEEHKKEYEDFLREAEGDEDEALRLLAKDENEWDYGVPYKFFEGKWLTISPDFKQNLRLDEHRSLEIPILMVKKEIEANASRDYLSYIKDISPQSSAVTEVLFESSVIQEHWHQDYVEVVLGKCKIDLLDFCEKKPEVFIPKPIEDKILLPLNALTEERLSDSQKRTLQDLTDHGNLSIFKLFHPELSVALSKGIIFPKKKKSLRDVEF